MAQKKKVPAKSQVKSKPKAASAVSAKPAKKMGEPTAEKSKKSAKSVTKSKGAVKAQAPKQAVKSKPAVKPVAKVADKATEKKKVVAAPAPVAKAVKPAVAPVAKPAVAPVAVQPKPVAAASVPVAPAAVKPAASAMPVAAAVAAAAKSGQPQQQPMRAPAASFAGANVARSLSTPAAKPAVRSFPTAAAGTPRDIAAKAVDARQQQIASAALAAAKKPVTARHGFKVNESIVYPAHGVGRIVGIEEQEIAGMSLELFVIQFEKDKMTLRVPTGKLQSVGMRKLAEDEIVTKAMETLKGRARVKRTMWSRRAQEYEAKINSGDLVSIAEVVRDLYRSESQPEQSYSERQLYEAALDRMAREIAAVARIDERGAAQRITDVLSKSAKGRRAVEGPAAEPVEVAAEDAKAA